MPRKIDIQDFAKRVERLCEFLLDKLELDAEDNDVIQDLRNTAADIQFEKLDIVRGLANHVRGFPTASEEKE
jgi:hypothetical protein